MGNSIEKKVTSIKKKFTSNGQHTMNDNTIGI
jgi:hypothetical protein